MRTKLFTSPLYRFFNRLADLVCVSLLTLAFSIPIITVFAAITAAHTVVQDMVFDTEQGIFKKYTAAFRANFKQSTIAGIIMLAAIVVALCNYFWFPTQFSGSVSTILRVFFGILLCLLLAMASCIYPLIARYHNPTVQHIKNALILCICALPRVLLVTLVNILPFLIFIFNPSFLVYTLVFWTFFGSGIIVYLTNLLLKKPILKIENIIFHFIPDSPNTQSE